MTRKRFSWLESLVRSWSPKRRPVRRHTRPWLEALESRVTPTAYTVTIAGDTASGSGGEGSGTSGDLRFCLNQAGADQKADTITFASSLAGQTIQLAGFGNGKYGTTAFVVNPSANITVDGSAAPGLTVSGGGNTRLFVVTGGGQLTLKNLTVANGYSKGGNGSSSADAGGGAGMGGAVFVDGNTSSFTAQGCTFVNNQAVGGNGSGANPFGNGGGGGLGGSGQGNRGGGSQGGTGSVSGRGKGGGFGGGGAGGVGSAQTFFSFLGGNHGRPGVGGAGGFGGGGGGGEFGNTHNKSSKGGTGGFGGGGGAPSGAAGFGGGAGGGHLTNTTPLSKIHGGGGGGAGMGGAIFSNQGNVTLVNDTFSGNSATGGAGGGQSGGPGLGLGAGVFMRNGNLHATFCTFANETILDGNGSTHNEGIDLYVLADGGNGGNNSSPAVGAANATVVNCIIASSGNSGHADVFFAGTPGGNGAFYDNNNLILQDIDFGTGGQVLIGNNDIIGQEPQLGSLASNGGPTATLALFGSSPALGKGVAVNGITTDQRGALRATPPDIGAFEFRAPPTVTGLSTSQGGSGAQVTVTGSGFSSGLSQVQFGNVAATSFKVLSDTSLIAVAPTNAGTVDVTVVNSNGTSPVTTADHFTYISSLQLVVNRKGDSGISTGTNSGDLRYVLNEAIQDAVPTTITFDPKVFTTSTTIGLTSGVTTRPSSTVNPYGPTAFVLGAGDNITINGNLGTAAGITLNGNGQRLFAVAGGGSLTLENLTLSGGTASGGAGVSGGGGGAGLGGAVFVDGTSSSFTADACTFVNNKAQGGAGGSGGKSTGGGGGGGMGSAAHFGVGGGANGGHPTTRHGNLGRGPGGVGGGGAGGSSSGGNFITVGWQGGFGGGGGAAVNTAGAGGFGGGGGGNFFKGAAGGFGGGYAHTGQFHGSGRGTIGAGGGGAGLGGAIFSNQGSVVLLDDTFASNMATGGAGGSPNGGAGQGLGGAVFVRNGTLTAVSDTFSRNTAQAGGAIYNLGDGKASAVSLTNSILANTSNAATDYQAATTTGGTTTNTGTNDLIMHQSGFSGSIVSTADPKLGPLTNNGGSTSTMALTTGSPAINAGTSSKGTASVGAVAGLVDWYSADGNAQDSIGAANGTLQGGATFASGKFGQAFSLNGSTAYVQLPNNLFPIPTSGTGNTPFSFSAWFQTTTGGVILGQQNSAAFGNPTQGVPAVYVGSNGHLYAQAFWGGAVNPISSSQAVYDGKFHNVVVSYNGSTESVYLDGKLVGSKSLTQIAYASSYQYQLGTGFTKNYPNTNGGWDSFKGLIDDAAVFNRALTAQDVQALQNNPAGLATDQRGFARVFHGKVDLGSVEYTTGGSTGVAVVGEPNNGTVGQPISPITVQAVDDAGNVVANPTPVTLSILSGPLGGHLSGTTTLPMVNGTAVFQDLTVSKPGTYVLGASSGTLGTDVTSSFTMVPAPAPSGASAPAPAPAAPQGPTGGLIQALDSALQFLATPQGELALALWLELGGASSLGEALLTFEQELGLVSGM